MADIIEIFADSGIVIERDFTEEELAQRELDVIAAETAAQEAAAAAQAAQEARESAINHAKNLGFTDDMIKVMFPGLGGM
jgi:hypothetical protein